MKLKANYQSSIHRKLSSLLDVLAHKAAWHVCPIHLPIYTATPQLHMHDDLQFTSHRP